jgi:type I restriction enzyme S subunit
VAIYDSTAKRVVPSSKPKKFNILSACSEKTPIGTILIAMYGQGLTRGRTGKLGIPATTNQACAAILPSPKINTDYLWTFLKLSYNEIRDLGRGGNQPNLNLSMVRDLVIPVPPLSLQEEFAGVAARVESLQGRMGESARGVEGLFESLLAEAFS